jgi:putative ABC transport system permease protein
MNGIWQDVRHATRSLIKNPLITVIAVMTLALGIGANTAIYTVLDATLLSPPPYEEPDRLVAIWGILPARDIDTWPAAPREIDDYQRNAELFEDFAGGFGNQHIYQQVPGAEPQQINSTGVTWNIFSMLGVKPMLGRDFNELDAAYSRTDVPPGVQPPFDTFNPPSTVILSHAFWQSRFGGDPGVLESTIYLDYRPVTIAGVMAPGFQLLLPGGINAEPEMYEASRVDLANSPRNNVFMNVIGRLRPGVSVTQAEAEMAAITARIAETETFYTTHNLGHRVIPLHQELTKDINTIVWVLTGAVALILLIACANVANLLLVRATSRQRDIAIRAALGCSRSRMFRFGLIEASLLALVGGILGVLLAALSLPVLISMQPQNLPQLSSIGIDFKVLAFTFVVVAVVTLLAGSIPAAIAARRDMASQLKDRTAQQESRGSGRWRNALVVAEVALSFALLVGAGLMIRSFADLVSRDPGFNPANVLTFTYALPAEKFPESEQQLAFHRELHSRIEALPGVMETGGAFPLPLSGIGFGSRWATDIVSFEDGSARQAQYHTTFPGYFETIGATMLAGRGFHEQDQETARNYVVVNKALADLGWPGESPLGKTMFIRRGDRAVGEQVEVIGVVNNPAHNTLDEESAEGVWFVSAFADEIGFGNGFSWTVRTSGDPMDLLAPVKAVLRDMDPDVPLQNENTLADIVGDSTATVRFTMTLTSIFGGLALLLAAVGLYGVLAYRVRQRRPELGVRLTFGAAPGGIFALVIRQGMVLVGIGLALWASARHSPACWWGLAQPTRLPMSASSWCSVWWPFWHALCQPGVPLGSIRL